MKNSNFQPSDFEINSRIQQNTKNSQEDQKAEYKINSKSFIKKMNSKANDFKKNSRIHQARNAQDNDY